MTELEVPDPLVVGRYTMCLWPKILLPNSDKPVTAEGRNHLTKALGTVIHLLLQAKIETADFERSECWDDMTKCWKPFGVEDFLAMLRYTYSMAISVYRDFEQLPKHYQEADAYLQPKNVMASGDYTGNTMRGMARMIHFTATSLNHVVRKLTKKIWASKGGVPTDEKEMPAVPDQVVPAIDLRCLRLWCVLNTKKKRQEFENPQNTLQDMENILKGLKFIIDPCYKESGVGFRPSTARKLQKLTEGPKNALDYNVPLMIHICTGMYKVKGKPFYVIHDSTAIGGTQERA